MDRFQKNNLNKWENFYEQSWAAKFEVMQDLVTKGEKHPLRVIGRLDTFVSYHKLEFSEHKTEFKTLSLDNSKNFKVAAGELTVDMDKTPTGQPFARKVSFLGENISVPHYFIKNMPVLIRDYLRNSNFDAIVELGSGFSRNLIELYYQGGPQIPYYGGEFTESGTECAKMLSALAPEMQLTPFRFDYKNPDLSAVKHKGRIFVFTCHSIEQVDKIPEDLLKKIAEHSREVVCMHIEPFGFQYTLNQSVSKADEEHAQGWNQNLFQVLLSSHQKGWIEIEYLGRNAVGGDQFNPTSVAVWRKTVK